MATEYTLEDAADALLLLFTQVEAGSEPTPGQVGEVVAVHAEPAFVDLSQYIAGHKGQARGARVGFELGTDALGRFAATNFGLAARLLAWSAKRADLSAAEVIAAMLGHTDVEEV